MPAPDPSDCVMPLNGLLAALPSWEYDHLLPHLEQVPFEFKAILYEPGRPLGHVYFPTRGILSLISKTEKRGDGIEVGLVGREGMACLSSFLETDISLFRCVVQVPGDGLRMRTKDFHEHVGRDSHLHGLLLRYTHAFMTQVSQSAACNSQHPIEKRLCRWLLAVHGRVGTDRFPLTHEFLAAMLGVRRASVTEAARGLRHAGLIRYGGGYLTVLDRSGLEQAACGCQSLIQKEFDRLGK